MKKHLFKYDVLIADDHKIFRVGLSAMLRNIACVRNVHEALNGKEALDILTKHPVSFVFMDIKMPVMDGIAATRAVSKSYPHIHVIAMSVYDDDRYLHDMLAGGAKGYLLKNTDQEEIEKAMQSILDGGVYYTKAVSDKLIQHMLPSNKTVVANGLVELTPREKQILYYLWKEMSSKEIAAKIFASVKTVELCRSRLLEKTNSKNSVALVKYAMQHGIIDEMEQSGAMP